VQAHPSAAVLEGCTITPDKSDNPFREGIENTEGGVYWSCNLGARREDFWAMGGFDEDFEEAGGEDMEFAFRFKRLGRIGVFVPRAVVLHPTRPVPLRRMIWRFRLGRWTRLYELKTGAMDPRAKGWRSTAWPILRNMTINQVRFTWWFVRNPIPEWRTRLFHLCLGWMLLPVNLIYQVYWDHRFRVMLAERADAARARSAASTVADSSAAR
jgi:GT2 family glycosyltransferase